MKANQPKLLLLVLLTCFSLHAQEKKTGTIVPKRVYTTKAVTNPPIIDGLLNDESWNVVEWTSDFIENEPDENTPPSYQTQFKIVYDAKFLYVGVRAFDGEPGKIEDRLSRRDGFAGDWVEINIDSYNDDRTGFSFTLTAAGVKGDEFISNNGNNANGKRAVIGSGIASEPHHAAISRATAATYHASNESDCGVGLSIIRKNNINTIQNPNFL